MVNLLTVGEVAVYLKTTTTTIYRWIKDGKLTAVKIGKGWRIDEAQLDAFVHTQHSAQETLSSFWPKIRQNEHLLLIADKNEDVAQFEAAFFERAISEDAFVLKGCWWQDEDELGEQYRKHGFDLDAMKRDGVLEVVDFNRLYKKEGLDGPVNAWRAQAERARAAGRRRLWASGSPTMRCCGNDSARVAAFESKLNEAIKSLPVVGVCPYSLEIECNREKIGELLSLASHHSGVAFFKDNQGTLFRA